MADKGLGRKFSPDDRDHQFLMTRKLAMPGLLLPSRKTWGIAPTALDQGNTGSCVGHGWANFLRCEPIKTNSGIDQLRWAIYDAAIQLDEWTDNDNDTARQLGTSVRAGAQAVTNFGRLKSYLWAFSLQPALEWVLTMGPIVLGTNWYRSMFTPDAKGVVEIKPFSPIDGGHCYLWRGANMNTGMATMTNSWGDSWGNSGDFLISFRDLERLIHEDGECATAIEQKLTKAG